MRTAKGSILAKAGGIGSWSVTLSSAVSAIRDSAWAETTIEEGCRRAEQWFRSLPIFEPRVNLGNVVGHKYPAIVSEHDAVAHFARFINESGVPWEAMHHQVAISRWLFDEPHPAATAMTPSRRRRKVDLALVAPEEFLAAQLPAADGGFTFDAFLEFKYLSDYWTVPGARVFGSPPPPMGSREQVEDDVRKLTLHLSTGACRLAYVIVFAECDHGFAPSFAADVETSGGCRVRLIRGYV